MPQTQTVAGLVGGADYLRQLLAQREADRIKAEQETYQRGMDAQKMALQGRSVGADETRAKADLANATRPVAPAKPDISILRGVRADGKAVTILHNNLDGQDTSKDVTYEDQPTTPPTRAPELKGGFVGKGGQPEFRSWDPNTNQTTPVGPEYQKPEKPEPPTAETIKSKIKPGSPEYRQAQDMADGSLSLADFQKLHGRSGGDATARAAIYDLARDLNPNFNPAQFEIGQAFAKSPKVQAQIASIKNVESGVPDLIKFSDAATRSGSPTLNAYAVKPITIALGGKKYSNFKTAVTAFADELSGALGYGSATDMSREMGFDMTDMNQGPENFASNVRDVVLPFVARKKASMLGQMGPYGGGVDSGNSGNRSGGGGAGQKVVSLSDLQKVATKEGKNIEDVKKEYAAGGYTIR